MVNWGYSSLALYDSRFGVFRAAVKSLCFSKSKYNVNDIESQAALGIETIAQETTGIQRQPH